MASKPRKTPRPAQSLVQHRASVVVAFLAEFHESDDLFDIDLGHLTQEHLALFRWIERASARSALNSIGWSDLARRAEAGEGERFDQISAYVADLRLLLQRYGLDQIPEAEQAFHTYAENCANSDHPPTRGILVVSWTDNRPPGIGDVSVRVSVDASWPFPVESRSGARDRILGLCEEQIDSALDRIVNDHDNWLWSDSKHEREKHIRWTVRRFRGESVQAIAQKAHIQPSTVSRATNRYAKVVGIEFP